MDEGNILDVEQSVETDNVVPESDSASSSDDEIVSYSLENPLPVTIVEEYPTGDIEVYAATGSAYGTISDTYLSYLTGVVEKLGYDEHYVIWRSGEYSYSLAYGEDMEIVGTLISGFDLDCVRVYRSSNNYNNVWYTEFTTLNNLELETQDIFAYSDLGNLPTVKRGLSSIEASTILFAIGFAVVFSVCNHIFDYILKYVYRK